MAKLIKKTVDIVFLGLLAIIVLAMAVSMAETVFRGIAAFVVGTGILALAVIIVVKGKSHFARIGRGIKSYLEPIPVWKLAIFLGLFSAVTKILLVFLFDNNADFHPDMAMYRSYAEQYAQAGRIVEGAGYAYNHSYMAFYGLILSPFAKIFGADTKVFTILLSILHSLAMVMLFDTLREYVKKEIAFSVLLLYCILPMGLLQTQLLTHENALFFFHVAAVWLFMKAFRDNIHWTWQILLVLGAAILLSLGKSVNAAGRVLMISFGIYAAAKCFSEKLTWQRTVGFLCALGILIGCYVGSTNMVRLVRNSTIEVGGSNQESAWAYPYGWSLYVGFNYDSQGMWSEEDAEVYYRYTSLDSKEAALQYQENLLIERLQQFKDEPIKIPVHIFHKIKTLWGGQLLPFAYELGNGVNEFVLYGMGGIVNKACILVSNVSSLLLYLMLLVAQVKKLRKKDTAIDPSLHFCMAIIGVTAALLLFEVTPKYVSHLHICFFGIFALCIKHYFCKRKMEQK